MSTINEKKFNHNKSYNLSDHRDPVQAFKLRNERDEQDDYQEDEMDYVFPMEIPNPSWFWPKPHTHDQNNIYSP